MKHPEYMHDRAVHLYSKGYSSIWIGGRLGVASSTIRLWLKERGVFTDRRNKINTTQLIELYNIGLIDAEIASELGSTPDYICLLRKKLGLEPNRTRNSLFDTDDIPDEEKPWHDPESLFCDGEFLKNITGKEPLKMGVGK